MNPSVKDSSPFFSIIVPAYNEAENLPLLYQEIAAAMAVKNRSFELIFVDDGSVDETPEALKIIQNKDPRIKIITFRKNFGKSAAFTYSFQEACGKYIVTLDADLQDDPAEIERMFETLEQKKADLVCGWKKNRQDPLTKIISSRLFNSTASWLTGIQLHDFNCGIKLYSQAVVKEIPMYGELHRFVPALAVWKGFVVVEHPVHHRARRFGKSKFGMNRFWGGIIDLLTVIFMMRYEGKPSHLFSGSGLILVAAGFLINLQLVIVKLMGGTIAPRYPYFILGVMSLIIGVQLICFGLISEMIVYSLKSKNPAPNFSILKRSAS